MDRNDASPSIDDQAIQWFVLLRDEDATQDDRAAFAKWLAADPSHEAAWRSVERMWSGLDAVAMRSQSRKPTRRRAGGVKRAAAAAVLLAAAGAGWQTMPVGLFADHRTAAGERRTVALQDGSEVELGTSTAVDVSFDATERRIRLLSGEAFFTVAKDPVRPFVVAAGNGEVKVLGTAFNVKITEDVMVTVTENTVQVIAATSSPVDVGAGREVRYGAHGISAVTEADLDAVQAWRQDQIVFRDVPLNVVLAEIGRYRRGSVVLFGGDLGKRHVTAVFEAHNGDEALDTIAKSLSLRIYRATPLLTVIVPDTER